jgi:hypothetical protein
MSGLIACISAFFSAFSRHRDLALENLALRQQLTIFKRRHAQIFRQVAQIDTTIPASRNCP